MEEERETVEEVIDVTDKSEKTKTDEMGAAESKRIPAGSWKADLIINKGEVIDKTGTSETKQKEPKDEKIDKGGSNDHVDGIQQNGTEGTDVDIKTDKHETEVIKPDLESNEDGNERKGKKNQDLEVISSETVKEGGSVDIINVASINKIKENGFTGSSDSDLDSSKYSSCEEEVKLENKNDETSTNKIQDDNDKDNTTHSGDSKVKEIPVKDSDNNKQDTVKAKADTKITHKKPGKNPLVRIQSKILDALSHSNFDSYTPEICIDFLKSPNLKLLSSLNKKLKQNKADWNEEFLELNGSGVLLDIVDTLGQKRVTQLSDALLLLECVECIKTLMNSKMGLEYLVDHGEYLKKLVKGKQLLWSVLIHVCLYWQTAQTLMRRRVLRRLIWVYAVCICPLFNAFI